MTNKEIYDILILVKKNQSVELENIERYKLNQLILLGYIIKLPSVKYENGTEDKMYQLTDKGKNLINEFK
jgi:predicted transcriptional regulator